MIDRIRDRDSFVRLRRDGVRVRVDSLWCSFVPDPTVRPPRAAFVISRAVGTAVVRNRLRRRLRALLVDSDLLPGLYLIGVQPAAARLTFVELRSCTARLMSLAMTKEPSKTAAR